MLPFNEAGGTNDEGHHKSMQALPAVAEGHSHPSFPTDKKADQSTDWATWARNVANGKNLWEPPQLLQRRQVVGPTKISSWILFPLELTSKDYTRRILDIVANSIKERVLSITNDAVEKMINGIENFSEDKMPFNLRNLLLVISGKNSETYAEALRCDPKKMANAADYLFQYEKQLSCIDKGANIKHDVIPMIYAAKCLLECFNGYSSYSLKQLKILEDQHHAHREFTERRRQILESDLWMPLIIEDKEDDCSILLAESAGVLNEILALLKPSEVAHILSLRRLEGIETHLDSLLKLKAEDASNTDDEAIRLQELLRAVQKAIESDLHLVPPITSVEIDEISFIAAENKRINKFNGSNCGRSISDLLIHVENTLQRVRAAEKKTKDSRHFSGENGSETLKLVGDEIVKNRDLLANLLILPIFTALETSEITLNTIFTCTMEQAGTKNSLFGLLRESQNDRIFEYICSSWLVNRNIFDYQWGSRVKEDEWCAVFLKDSRHFTATELKAGGFRASDLKPAGFTILDLQEAGYNVSDLRTAGFGVNMLEQAGLTLSELRDGGFSASSLKSAYFRAKDLKAVGFSAGELREGGFSADDMKSADFKVNDLKIAGCSASELKTANFTAIELKNAGFTLADLKESGYPLSKIKAVDYSLSELKEVGFTLYELKEAGFTLSKLKTVGFDLGCLEAADFTGKDLRLNGWIVSYLRISGVSANIMKSAGFTANQSRVAGFTISDLKAAGYPMKELDECDGGKATCWSVSNLKKDNLIATHLKAAGFRSGYLRALGFSAIQLKAAYYSFIDLTVAGFSAYELKEAGYTLEDLVAAQTFTKRDLEYAGFTSTDLEIIDFDPNY